MEIKYKKLLSRILSRRFVSVFLVALAVTGVFGAILVKADSAPINYDQLNLKVQLSKSPTEGSTEIDKTDPNYTALLAVEYPNSVSVGDDLNLGPRSSSVKVAGFGLGLMKTGQEEELCKNYGSHTSCDFLFTVPVVRSVLENGQPASGSISLDPEVLTLLGLEPGQESEVAIYPFVEADNGQKLVNLANKTTTENAGEVLFSPFLVPWYSVYNYYKGSGLLGFVNSILTLVASGFTEVMFAAFSWFILPFLEAVLAIRTYTDNFADVIYPAWEVIRNLSNILFILAIIAAGLATIFRVGGWQAKEILVKLVIGAILINFSLLIAQGILGIADTLQNQFLSPNSGAVRVLGDTLIRQGINKAWEDLSKQPELFGSFAESVRIIISLVLGFVSLVAFGLITFLLAIRIVFLWLLLLASPLPYVAMVLPITKSFSSRWWSNFIKYAFMTPAMAFMLNLTALIATKQADLINNLASRRYNTIPSSIESAMFVFGANAIVLIFMFLSLKVATMIGAESGGIVEKVSEKGWRAAVGGSTAPLRAGGAGIRAGAGVFNRWKTERSTPLAQKGLLGKAVFSALNPTRFKEAWVERREARGKTINTLAQGAAANIIQDLPLIREPGSDSQSEAFVKIMVDKGKELPYVSERAAGGNIKNIMSAGDKAKSDLNSRGALWGQIQNLVDEKGLNYVLTNWEELSGGKMGNFDASREGYVKWMNEMVKNDYITEAEAGHVAAKFSDSAYKNKEYWYAEGYDINEDGHPEMIKTDRSGNILGRNTYNTENENIESAFETSIPAGLSPEDKADWREQNFDKFKKQYLEDLKKSKPSVYKDYNNFAAYQNGIDEGFSNYSKGDPQGIARDVHWSFPVEVQPNGKHKFSEYGIRAIAEADQGDYSQGGRVQPKKRQAMIRAIKQNEEKAIEDLADYFADQEVERLMKEEGKTRVQARAQVEAEKESDRDNNKHKQEARKKLMAFKRFYVNAEKYESGYDERDDYTNYMPGTDFPPIANSKTGGGGGGAAPAAGTASSGPASGSAPAGGSTGAKPKGTASSRRRKSGGPGSRGSY